MTVSTVTVQLVAPICKQRVSCIIDTNHNEVIEFVRKSFQCK